MVRFLVDGLACGVEKAAFWLAPSQRMQVRVDASVKAVALSGRALLKVLPVLF
jgi:hypothetical protein